MISYAMLDSQYLEIQIKTTMRCHHTLAVPNILRDVDRASRTLIHYWREQNTVHIPWENVFSTSNNAKHAFTTQSNNSIRGKRINNICPQSELYTQCS